MHVCFHFVASALCFWSTQFLMKKQTDRDEVMAGTQGQSRTVNTRAALSQGDAGRSVEG